MTPMEGADRTLSAELFSTVDGYAAGTKSEGYFGMYGPELAAWIEEQTSRPHVMVMGRKTYVQLAEFASTQADDPSFARTTELPKLIFSSTLTEPLPWANSTLVREPRRDRDTPDQGRARRPAEDDRLVVVAAQSAPAWFRRPAAPDRVPAGSRRDGDCAKSSRACQI